MSRRLQPTPAAIHEGMRFIETAFRDNPTAPDHALIPTAVFSQPKIGAVGLTEAQAGERYIGLEAYRTAFA